MLCATASARSETIVGGAQMAVLTRMHERRELATGVLLVLSSGSVLGFRGHFCSRRLGC